MSDAHADLSAVRGLIRRARTRLRLQGALDGLATSAIAAAAVAVVVVFAVRVEWLSAGQGTIGLLAAAGVLVLGAALGAARRPGDETIARRIDDASGLADRLSTAIAFERELSASGTAAGAAEHAETRALMQAAIRDAARVAPRADVVAATPYHLPRDARPALLFAVVGALVAGLTVPLPDRSPRLLEVRPAHVPPGH